jgi:hypothetical protein
LSNLLDLERSDYNPDLHIVPCINTYVKFFTLIEEAENSGYMLGQHSARSGETPRGFSNQSVYANLGFYKRDPSLDVKHPTSPVPEAVLSTIDTIVKSLLYIHKQKKSKDVLNILLPYVYNFEEFRNLIVMHQRVIEALGLARKKLETLEAQQVQNVEEEKFSDALQEQINQQEQAVVGLEKQDSELEAKLNQLSEILEESRQVVIDEFIDEVIKLCIPNSELGKGEKIKEAYDRYIALVYGRREEVRTGLNRSYLLLDPVISLMRFYNNTLLQARQLEDKESPIMRFASSGKKGRNVLAGIQGKPGSEQVNTLIDGINRMIVLRSRSDKADKSPVMMKYKASMTKAFRELAQHLLPKTKIILGVLTNKFLKNKPVSEGPLKRFILLDVQKEIGTIK